MFAADEALFAGVADAAGLMGFFIDALIALVAGNAHDDGFGACVQADALFIAADAEAFFECMLLGPGALLHLCSWLP